MSTAEKPPANFHSVAYYPAFAVLAYRSDGLDGTLEAVESMARAGGDQIETLVVLVSTNFTGRHSKPPFNGYERSPDSSHQVGREQTKIRERLLKCFFGFSMGTHSWHLVVLHMMRNRAQERAQSASSFCRAQPRTMLAGEFVVRGC